MTFLPWLFSSFLMQFSPFFVGVAGKRHFHCTPRHRSAQKGNRFCQRLYREIILAAKQLETEPQPTARVTATSTARSNPIWSLRESEKRLHFSEAAADSKINLCPPLSFLQFFPFPAANSNFDIIFSLASVACFLACFVSSQFHLTWPFWRVCLHAKKIVILSVQGKKLNKYLY